MKEQFDRIQSQKSIQGLLGELATEVYKLKRWKSDVGDNPDTEEEKWFDTFMDRLNSL